MTYTKAYAEVIWFDNSDVITTSGVNGGCTTVSNENGVDCAYNMTAIVGVECWPTNAPTTF